MRPLQMTEILVVKGFRQRALVILEAVDGAVFGIKKRPAVPDFTDRILHDAAHANGCIDRVPRVVDGAMLVDVKAGKVQVRMAKDRLFQIQLRTQGQFRTKQRNRLRM